MNNIFYKKLIFTVFIMSSFFVSCSRDTVYNKFQPIKNKVWEKNDEYYFTFNIIDNTIPYDLSLQLRNSDIYPYQNLWLFCEEQQPERTIIKDTIECMLADDFGKWVGNGISLFQSQFFLRKNYRFPSAGQYVISIRHGMRDDKIKGIEDVGLLIDKVEN